MKAFLIAALLTALWTADASACGRRWHRLFRHHTRAAVGCSSCQ